MKNSISLLHWFPRIMCILSILILSMFAFDAFTPGLTLWQQMGDFLIHLIPSFALIAMLIVAWKWELIGGILFIVMGLALSAEVFLLNLNRTHSIMQSLAIILILTIPFVVAGILFIASNQRNKRKQAIQ